VLHCGKEFVYMCPHTLILRGRLSLKVIKEAGGVAQAIEHLST
jgi:hypothetical protein